MGKLNISINRLYGGNTCILGGMGKGGLVVIPVAWGIRVDWWADGSKVVIPTASWGLRIGVFVLVWWRVRGLGLVDIIVA